MNFAALAVPAVIAWGTYQDANAKKQEGWNPYAAWGAAVATQGFMTMLSVPALVGVMGVQFTAGAGQMAIQGAYSRNMMAYQARIPFSNQFRHTDTTAQMQMAGLQSIGASWAHGRMGSEAAAMAQQYGRG